MSLAAGINLLDLHADTEHEECIVDVGQIESIEASDKGCGVGLRSGRTMRVYRPVSEVVTLLATAAPIPHPAGLGPL